MSAKQLYGHTAAAAAPGEPLVRFLTAHDHADGVTIGTRNGEGVWTEIHIPEREVQTFLKALAQRSSAEKSRG